MRLRPYLGKCRYTGCRVAREVVHIEGMTDLQRTLTTVLPRESRNILRRTVVSIAKDVRKDMENTVRKSIEDDGTLRRAITHRRERGAREHQEAAVWIEHGKGVSDSAHYWHIIEWGSLRTSEKPYIRPTVKTWQSRLGDVFRERFGLQLEKEMAKRAKK